MSLEGSVQVTGWVGPTSTGDTFPTHVALYGRDGLRNVATELIRNEIPFLRREIGMVVGIQDTNDYWRLISNPTGDTSNSDWGIFLRSSGYTDTYVVSVSGDGVSTITLQRNDDVNLTLDLSTLSALTVDNYVTDFTINSTNNTATITMLDGATHGINLSYLVDTNSYVTGGTYNQETGVVTYTTSSGSTFEVSGFTTGMTDTFVTGGTVSGTDLTLELNDGSESNPIDLSPFSVDAYWTSGSSESDTSIRTLANVASGGDATGEYSVAEGHETLASGRYSHAEGNGNLSIGDASHTEGGIYWDSKAGVEYYPNTASTYSAHAEGSSTLASGLNSHAEGYRTTASGDFSHTEGYDGVASGRGSHAEGSGTLANGESTHAEGRNTIASGNYSHSEGSGTIASGGYSHAEGRNTMASGDSSHAGGYYAQANGGGSFNHSNNTMTNPSIVNGNYSAILGGVSNILTSDAIRSVLLGGTGLTGDTADTVYVPRLNIDNIVSGGTSVNHLGIDANGFVVVGSSGSTPTDIQTINRTTPSVVSSALTLDFDSKNLLISTKSGGTGGAIVIDSDNTSVIYSGDSNMDNVWFTVEVQTSPRVLIFPTNHKSSDYRWDGVTKELSLALGFYQISIMNNGIYKSITCSLSEV